MPNHKKAITTAGILVTLAAIAFAQDTAPKSVATTNTKAGTNAVVRVSVKQADVASKTAKFGTVPKADDSCKKALDAHALDDAQKLSGKDGAFKGKVTQIFEPKNGTIAIVNFDANYRNALTALLTKNQFTNFPPLTNLVGREVLVAGKFIDYQGRAEIVLTNVSQVKLVE